MLVAMSRIIWKIDFACLWNTVPFQAVLLKVGQDRRNWICFPLLVSATFLCLPAISIAQQNDRSVLVVDGSGDSAGSNAQVELEAQVAQPADSTPMFRSITASTLPSLPSPPASVAADSNNAANFRLAGQRTLTAAPKIETPPAVKPLRPTTNDDGSVLATSALLPTRDSGTFASQLPGDSGQQSDNSFNRPPASSDLRAGSASTTPRGRFGDFGRAPAPPSARRFAQASSAPTVESKPRESAPLTQPAATPAAIERPVRPDLSKGRFGPPAASTSNKLTQPPLPKATAPQPSQPLAPSITTRPIPSPPTSPRITQPQANSQSVTSLNDNSQGDTSLSSGRFQSTPRKFANPTSSSLRQPSSLQSTRIQQPSRQPSSGQQRSFGDSSVSTPSNASSRSLVSRGAAPNANSSSRKVIPRQPSSSSPTSFPGSSSNAQSILEGSRVTQQPSDFASQPSRQSLRGTPINNDLRGNTTNNQTRLAQRSTQPTDRNRQNVGQSSGKADRASIDFAKQQLRNIQTARAGATGTPVRLQEMFLEPLTGSQRKLMVAQYWETYYDLAALKISTDYAGWLNSISTSSSEQGLLSAAQQMAADQQLAARIQLGKSQSRLMDFMPNPRPSEFTPLPADEPLVEHYVTDYEKYKRVRTLPTSLRGIDPMLASTLKLITQRAATVSMAKDAVDQAGRNRQIPLASAIAAGKLWRDSQMDMVASTVSYNQAISDFVLTLEPNRSPEQLTAFMLGAPKNGSQPSTTTPQNQPQASRNANQQGYPPSRQLFR